ncbi:MAG: UDP-3-O-acyl-N-acetylglucosamine deacetylase [Lentisphaerae bacterium]|nr:UDP-3-O-acyl-N-acetylglucosamine deacetylase [Lentisphaerota bacterium]
MVQTPCGGKDLALSSTSEHGRILEGDPDVVRRAHAAFAAQTVDLDLLSAPAPALPSGETTLGGEVSATGPGTFFGRAQRTLTFCPSTEKGWWIERRDQPDALPVRVSIENVWTTGAVVSNIVLRSGSPHNYLRMVEHIIALRVGLGIDSAIIRVDAGDPPLFDRGSLDLVEAIDRVGIVERPEPAAYWTVREPVTLCSPQGNFVTIHPAARGQRGLTVDCAVDFPNAIGKQRIRFPVNRDTTRQGAVARTNTTRGKMLYCKTLGKIFADIRNLGYTTHNVLVAGPREYVNEPRLMHNGKSLEAVWHRAVLDLLAAVALIGHGRLAGHILSYKAGHVLDCRLITRLYQLNLLEPLR